MRSTLDIYLMVIVWIILAVAGPISLIAGIYIVQGQDAAGWVLVLTGGFITGGIIAWGIDRIRGKRSK